MGRWGTLCIVYPTSVLPFKMLGDSIGAAVCAGVRAALDGLLLGVPGLLAVYVLSTLVLFPESAVALAAGVLV